MTKFSRIREDRFKVPYYAQQGLLQLNLFARARRVFTYVYFFCSSWLGDDLLNEEDDELLSGLSTPRFVQESEVGG
jgi:hypothetical protein